MAECFKAAVLKTAERKLRGFESYRLRHTRSGAGPRRSFTDEHSTRVVGQPRPVRAPAGPAGRLAPSYTGEVTERLKVLAC